MRREFTVHIGSEIILENDPISRYEIVILISFIILRTDGKCPTQDCDEYDDFPSQLLLRRKAEIV